MKTISRAFIMILLFPVFLCSCEKENNANKQGEIHGRILNVSDCKSNLKSTDLQDNTPDSISCIDFTFDADSGILCLKHINAGFNCCPGEIGCAVSLSGDTLIINETESSSLCNCDCLFDLDIRISGILKKSYLVRFTEPYAYGMEALEFDIDLKDSGSGSFCVTRRSYPWGVKSTM
jgi:hypothetical protein